MDQPGLFDAPYPAQPGWKAEGTSRKAAEAMKPRAPSIRERIVSLVKDNDLTPDEAAAILGETVLAVRPRFSEAARLGLIEDTGRTRRNASGLKATVWRYRRPST